MTRWRPLVLPTVILAATVLVLFGGYQLKAQCTEVPWDGTQHEKRCYTDHLPLFGGRNLDDGARPYLDADGFLEYPVLTGLLMWTAAQGANAGLFGWEGGLAFLRWNALLLAPFALGISWLLYRMADTPTRALTFALGPPLLLYAFHNWDLPAVFFLVLALQRWEAGRRAQSGIALALGGAFKLFPWIVMPLLFVLLVRRSWDARVPIEGTPWRPLLRSAFSADAWRFAGAFLATIVIVHLPMLWAGGGPQYLEFFRFHIERGGNLESVWTALDWSAGALGLPYDAGTATALSKPLFLLGYLGVAAWAWVASPSVRGIAFAALFVLLVPNTFFSVQYALWVLPLFALLPLPPWSYVAFVGADLFVFHAVFAYFAVGAAAGSYPTVAIGVLFRAFVLVALLVATVRLAAQTRPWSWGWSSSQQRRTRQEIPDAR